MEFVQVKELKPKLLKEAFHFARGKDLLVTKQMRRIHCIQKGGILAARETIGKHAYLMIKTVPARCIDQ